MPRAGDSFVIWFARAISAVACIPVAMYGVRAAAASLRYPNVLSAVLALVALTLAALLGCFATFGSRPAARKYLTAAVMGGFVVGAPAFLIGFVGPILLNGGNQGPLLGIFITGPIGFVLGCLGGVVWAAKRPRLTRQPGSGVAFARGVLAIVVGFVVVSVVGSVIELVAVAVNSTKDPSAYLAIRAQPMMLAAFSVWKGAAAFLGGYVVARIAGYRPVTHGVVLATIQVALVLWAAMVAVRSGQPYPRGELVVVAVMALAICCGAQLHSRLGEAEPSASMPPA